MRRAHRLSCFLASIAFALGACSAEKTGGGEDAATNAHEETSDAGWLTGGHDAGETYFSPLKQVNASNIEKLGFAWSYDLNSTHGMEATPVVIDGVMYASAPWGYVHALDAKTGAKLWVSLTAARQENSVLAKTSRPSRSKARSSVGLTARRK